MLKSILLGGAMLLAMPALAQTANTSTGQSGTATTTNDHDPTMEDSQTAAGTANATVSTQVNGGTTSASTGVGRQGNATEHQGMNHGTMPGHQGMNHGTGMTAAPGTMTTSTAATRDYPICSRTVTDSCRQVATRRTRR